MNALYYPFHLCHDRTLERLLENHQTIHFRDFMALQLTPMMGTTAFPDRMGDYHPELLESGQIVQGYNLSGGLLPTTVASVNQDLADTQWRRLFQESLLTDHRFQRGLFSTPKEISTSTPPNNPEWVQFHKGAWTDTYFDVEIVRALSSRRLPEKEAAHFEYGWALIKTSAALMYTIQLCQRLHLAAATDSVAHSRLLLQSCLREHIQLQHSCMNREGY